jgi:hypothetical protein
MPASPPRLRWQIDKQTVKIRVDGDWVWLVIDPPTPPLALDHDGAIGLAEALAQAASGLDRSTVTAFMSVPPLWWVEEPFRVCIGGNRMVIKWFAMTRLVQLDVNQVDDLIHDLHTHVDYLKTGKLAASQQIRKDARDGTLQIVQDERRKRAKRVADGRDAKRKQTDPLYYDWAIPAMSKYSPDVNPGCILAELREIAKTKSAAEQLPRSLSRCYEFISQYRAK